MRSGTRLRGELGANRDDHRRKQRRDLNFRAAPQNTYTVGLALRRAYYARTFEARSDLGPVARGSRVSKTLRGKAALNTRNFFAELKRRNVYKVAIAYAVVGWLLIQIATQVFPFFEIPNWAVRLVVLLLVIGFPVALIIAWAFELTPEGIKRAEDVDVSKSITRKTGRKLDFFIIAVLLLVIGILLFQRLHRNVSPTVSLSLEKSIAVLPFENLSEEKQTPILPTAFRRKS